MRSWSERIRVDGGEADLVRALRAVRPAAERLEATQFEVIVAAAFQAWAEAGVRVAAVEAGLGGRLDATNVVDAPVVVLTNVDLDHTELLGETRELIAAEKLAVVPPGATVVVGEPEWERLARASGAGTVIIGDGTRPLDLAVRAVEAYLGRPVDSEPAARVRLPGRLERRGSAPQELWDGAHNPAGVRYLVEWLPAGTRFVVCTSILADKGSDEMLALLVRAGSTLVATCSSNPRALPAGELARRAAAVGFAEVEAVAGPRAALARARALAGPAGAVLVTGSLYLLADLAADGGAPGPL